MDDSIAERLAKLDYLLARQEISDCLQRISRGVDRFDRDSFVSGYHPDAIIDAGAFVGLAGDVYDSGAILHEKGQFSTMHGLLNHSCEIDGDVAHTETYYLYVGHNRDDTNWAAGGRYVDRFEKRDGAWKIAFRITTLNWSTMIPAVKVPLFENVKDIYLNGAQARGKDDISYLRPLVNRRAVVSHDDPGKLSMPH